MDIKSQELLNGEGTRKSYIVLQSPGVQVLVLGYSPSQGDETALCLSQGLQVSPTHNHLCDSLGK